MNQSIIFPDHQDIDKDKHAVCFHAQQSGALIVCYVSIDDISKRHKCALEEDEAILSAFDQHRFDFEDLAEVAIEEESFNDQGEIWVS
ncbi:DUF1488 family protein [Enterovibrio calviensis]|uniref:DUF1488 domain-containing protein n=1 Tax=Enterovibrio calviensis TaxID=91359 RepID=UPI00048795CD|nr:DUF1488 domain-containing protein [Enterovibrio calviensis]